MAVIANSGGMSPRFSPLLPFNPSKHSATFFLTQTRNEKKNQSVMSTSLQTASRGSPSLFVFAASAQSTLTT